MNRFNSWSRVKHYTLLSLPLEFWSQQCMHRGRHQNHLHPKRNTHILSKINLKRTNTQQPAHASFNFCLKIVLTTGSACVRAFSLLIQLTANPSPASPQFVVDEFIGNSTLIAKITLKIFSCTFHRRDTNCKKKNLTKQV